MFTGLIAGIGVVGAVRRDGAGATLEIASELASELASGDSIAVDGVCLTATAVGPGRFEAQAMHETLERSTLGRLAADQRVNLELPLRAEDRLGGHIVQGHVDGIGRVADLRDEGFALVLAIDADQWLLRYVVEKGSIAVDGVSLTVSGLREGGFEVALIPETLARTALADRGVGAPVNLEADVLAKHVERLLGASAGVAS